jgi:hypothetical protein
MVERINSVNGGQPRQHLLKTLIPLRPGAPAFNAKTVTFANHMEIRQMSHTPDPGVCRRCIEGDEINRLRHTSIGQTPDERCAGKIAAYQDCGICQRRNDQTMRNTKIFEASCPARGWPRPHRNRYSADGDGDSCRGRIHRAEPRSSMHGQMSSQHLLRQML